MATTQGRGEKAEKREVKGEEVVIREKGNIDPTLTEKVDSVMLERIKEEHQKEITEIERQVEREKVALSKADADKRKHQDLRQQALNAATQKDLEAKRMKKLEQKKEQAKDRAMKEEWDLEKQRAAKHEEAVKAEEERAKAEAVKVLKEREAEHSRKLAAAHQTGIEYAEKLEEAHKEAIRELERKRERLESEVRIRVQAQRQEVQQPPVEIKVEVKPRPIPEAHIPPKEHANIASAGAVMEEIVPPAKVEKTEQKTVKREEKERESVQREKVEVSK